MPLWPQEKLALEAGRTVTRKELSAAARDAGKALDLQAGPAGGPVRARRLLGRAGVGAAAGLAVQRLSHEPHRPDRAGDPAHPAPADRPAADRPEGLAQRQALCRQGPGRAGGRRLRLRSDPGLCPARGVGGACSWSRSSCGRCRKRAFDEVTICRRAAEEALSALAEHFPELDRSELEDPAEGPAGPHAEPLEGHAAGRSPGGLAAVENGRLRKPSIKRAMPDSESVTLITTTDLLVRLVTKAFRRKLRRFVKPNKPPEHLSPELILEACPTLSDYGQPVRDLADIVSAGRYLRASLGAHESAWAEAVEEIGIVRAAIAVIYVLQLYEDDVARNGGESRIKNPGGYFRALVRMVKAGKIDLGVELLAMRRRRMS